jgi:hypothetical protein
MFEGQRGEAAATLVLLGAGGDSNERAAAFAAPDEPPGLGGAAPPGLGGAAPGGDELGIARPVAMGRAAAEP